MKMWRRKAILDHAVTPPAPEATREAPVSSESHAGQRDDTAPPLPAAKAGRLRMGLLLAASALGGGIAVVVYNRRVLASIREPRPVAPEPTTSFWDDGA